MIAKWILKKVFLKENISLYFWATIHTRIKKWRSSKATKKWIVRLQLNLDPRASFLYKRKAKKRFLVFKNCSGDELVSAKWKELNGKPDKINELILKTKVDLKERRKGLITCNSYACVTFCNWLVSFGEGNGGTCLKLNV